MADIELVIKIPEEQYNYILKSDDSLFINCVSKECMMYAIKTGTPLDELRTKIKGKIVKRPWLNFEDRERDRNDAFLEVLDIIDKYSTENEV